MYIEEFLNNCNERHLAEFARNCGLELDDFIICDGHIRVKLINPSNNLKLFYNLFDFHIEEPENGIHSMENTKNLSIIQKEWRKYLRYKFGNKYVMHYNTWLDNQKLPYLSKGKHI